MRIRIPAVTLEVDREKWAREYGTGTIESDVREDVKRYFDLSNCIPEHLASFVQVVK